VEAIFIKIVSLYISKAGSDIQECW